MDFTADEKFDYANGDLIGQGGWIADFFATPSWKVVNGKIKSDTTIDQTAARKNDFVPVGGWDRDFDLTLHGLRHTTLSAADFRSFGVEFGDLFEIGINPNVTFASDGGAVVVTFTDAAGIETAVNDVEFVNATDNVVTICRRRGDDTVSVRVNGVTVLTASDAADWGTRHIILRDNMYLGADGSQCFFELDRLTYVEVDASDAKPVTYYAIDSGGAPVTGDAANHALFVTPDDGTQVPTAFTPSEKGGGLYAVPLSTAEVDGTAELVLTGRSTTTDVYIVPRWLDLATAAAAQAANAKIGTPATTLAQDIQNIEGGGGGGTVIVTPTLATSTNPRYSTRDLPPIAQGSEPTDAITVTNATGAAVDLSGKTVRIVFATVDEDADTEDVVDDTLTGAFKYETGGGGITIGGAGNNVVNVQHDAEKTATPGPYRFFLWNITDGIVLAKGKMKIEPAVVDVEA